MYIMYMCVFACVIHTSINCISLCRARNFENFTGDGASDDSTKPGAAAQRTRGNGDHFPGGGSVLAQLCVRLETLQGYMAMVMFMSFDFILCDFYSCLCQCILFCILIMIR